MSNYPSSPGFKKFGTSEEAARSMKQSASSLQQKIIRLLQVEGSTTADICAEKLGVDRLAIRPRFTELAKLGIIRETGEKRKNKSGRMASVYRLINWEKNQRSMF